MLEICEEEDIEVIRPLWEVLTRHHKTHSRHFCDTFNEGDFDAVKLEATQCDAHRVEVVYLDKKPLGFSLALHCGQKGCVKGLYIYDDLRGKGLGSYLMNRMVLWLKTKEVTEIEIDIFAGNEEVMTFFKKLNFRVEKYVMKHMNKEGV